MVYSAISRVIAPLLSVFEVAVIYILGTHCARGGKAGGVIMEDGPMELRNEEVGVMTER